MTSAARSSTGRAYAEGRGYGLVLFAGVLLLVVGLCAYGGRENVEAAT